MNFLGIELKGGVEHFKAVLAAQAYSLFVQSRANISGFPRIINVTWGLTGPGNAYFTE